MNKKTWLKENFNLIAVSFMFFGCVLIIYEMMSSVYLRGLGWFIVINGTMFYAFDWYGLIQ